MRRPSSRRRPRPPRLGSEYLWTKAPALLQSVVNNHALVDGNKRLGWLAAATFLELNGVPVTAIADDDVYDLVMGVATDRRDVAALAAELRGVASPG